MAINFVDAATGYHSVQTLPSKSGPDVAVAIATFLSETGAFGTVHELHTDSGTEFVNDSVQTLLRERGIQHRISVPYESDQSGRAERGWSRILPLTRCALAESKLSHKHWGAAMRYACHVINQTPRPYQHLKQLDVHTCIGRDIHPSEIATMLETLSQWHDTSLAVLGSLPPMYGA